MKDTTLTAPNRGALWATLALTKTQLADICGLTARQVSHWTSQGYIMHAGPDPERYNGDAVDLCMLIKQGLDGGLPLKRAVEGAKAYVSAELSRQPGMGALTPAVLLDICSQLRSSEAVIGGLLDVIEPLVPNKVIAFPGK